MLVGDVFLVLLVTPKIIPPTAPPAVGNFPGEWGEEDRQGRVAAVLRRLVLRRPSANGRRKQGRTPAFCSVFWPFWNPIHVLITRRS